MSKLFFISYKPLLFTISILISVLLSIYEIFVAFELSNFLNNINVGINTTIAAYIVMLILFKIMLNLSATYISNIWAYKTRAEISGEVYETYQIKRGLAETNIKFNRYSDSLLNTDLYSFSSLFLLPTIHLISDFIILSSFSVVLYFILPIEIIFIIMIGVTTYLSIFILVLKLTSKLGSNRKIIENKRSDMVSAWLKMNLDLISLNWITASKEKFYHLFKKIGDIEAFQTATQSSLRVFFEIFLLVIICTIFTLSSNEKINIGVTDIGVLVFLSLKILPTYNRIIYSINSITYSKPIYKSIRDILYENKHTINTKLKWNKEIVTSVNRIAFNNLELFFQNSNLSKKQVFTNLSFEVIRNKINVIYGESGVGKSTLLKCLAGYNSNFSGYCSSLEFINQEYKHCYVSSESYYFQGTLFENLFFDNLKPSQDQLKLAENLLFQTKLLDELGANLHKINLCPFGKNGIQLSSGQIERLALVRALLTESDIYYLDEPTSNLDKLTAILIFNLIKKLSNEYTFIISTHDKFFINNSENLIEIKNDQKTN
ncbi:ABC transporter ATP-binding protein/permease [Alphaproteobacteria bacterium]|nr:ABC transporter ATP-binding protein/permease [Alphaproteobacteria bacterium]